MKAVADGVLDAVQYDVVPLEGVLERTAIALLHRLTVLAAHYEAAVAVVSVQCGGQSLHRVGRLAHERDEEVEQLGAKTVTRRTRPGWEQAHFGEGDGQRTMGACRNDTNLKICVVLINSPWKAVAVDVRVQYTQTTRWVRAVQVHGVAGVFCCVAAVDRMTGSMSSGIRAFHFSYKVIFFCVGGPLARFCLTAGGIS